MHLPFWRTYGVGQFQLLEMSDVLDVYDTLLKILQHNKLLPMRIERQSCSCGKEFNKIVPVPIFRVVTPDLVAAKEAGPGGTFWLLAGRLMSKDEEHNTASTLICACVLRACVRVRVRVRVRVCVACVRAVR